MRVLLTMVLALPVLAADGDKPKKPEGAREPQIGHMVFFKLKSSSPETKQKLVALCKQYLSSHDGTVHFSTGIIGDDFKRKVNDRDWDVSLHLVFKNKAAHDVYQDHAEHKKFIAEIEPIVESVRVFDSEVFPLKDGEAKIKKGEGDKGEKKPEGDKK